METPFDETRKVRRAMRDLVALSALPAIWVSYQPHQVAESLADLLLNRSEVRGRKSEVRGQRSEVGEEGAGVLTSDL